MSFEPQLLRQIIEAALLAAGQPLSVDKLLSLFEGEDETREAPEREQIRAALEELQAECAGRGFELKEVASGWRLQVRNEMAPWVNRLWEEKPQKYSRALLETLALIAYRQPITRGDIEEIRGVAVSSHIIKTLSEREWIKVVGHRDVPGRPSLYATTRHFLDYFNLKSLEDLPSLSELQDIDQLNAELDLGGGEGAPAADSEGAEADADATVPETDEAVIVVEDAAAEVSETDEEHSSFADDGMSEEELEEPAAPIPVFADEDEDDEDDRFRQPSGPSVFD
ncbi:SMC-Scp complex subunit ScpB [Pseudomaricurvus sp. HS19]|uniref:SMC-Scp complex subunit ScpB n=1 Tax=Pseudomaricurvus sp. HS19 TaxID=2692626 RepID=UPI00136C6A4C|nr:SMC-Scp complex subunit ScpB [Pseudomaricurvus sp. HS19]MYM62654.1 SMC-Scp complex subunit ScpB [Pseudomaricurvus sp. HS19]